MGGIKSESAPDHARTSLYARVGFWLLSNPVFSFRQARRPVVRCPWCAGHLFVHVHAPEVLSRGMVVASDGVRAVLHAVALLPGARLLAVSANLCCVKQQGTSLGAAIALYRRLHLA